MSGRLRSVRSTTNNSGMADALVIISDTHVHPYADSPVDAQGNNLRLIDIIACLDRARVLAEKEGAGLLHLGDVCHNRKGVPPEALESIGDWLTRCRESGVSVDFLSGNHDLSIGGDGSSSVRGFASAATAHTSVVATEIAGTRIGWLPYTEDPAEVRAATKKLHKAGCTVLLAHLGLGDPRYANCVPSDYEAPGRINVDDLRPGDFAQVFLGHYHKYQMLGTNVRYVGSPLQLSFNEVGHEKNILLYRPGKNKVTLIPNTWSPQFHKLDSAAAIARMAHGEIKERDPVWVTNVESDEVGDFKKFGEERGMPVRIEKSRPATARVRIDAGGKQADILKQYVRAIAPDTADLSARVDVGLRLINQEK